MNVQSFYSEELSWLPTAGVEAPERSRESLGFHDAFHQPALITTDFLTRSTRQASISQTPMLSFLTPPLLTSYA